MPKKPQQKSLKTKETSGEFAFIHPPENPTLESLPTEVKEYIFAELPLTDLAKLSASNKDFHYNVANYLLRLPQTWRKLIVKIWGKQSLVQIQDVKSTFELKEYCLNRITREISTQEATLRNSIEPERNITQNHAYLLILIKFGLVNEAAQLLNTVFNKKSLGYRHSNLGSPFSIAMNNGNKTIIELCLKYHNTADGKLFMIVNEGIMWKTPVNTLELILSSLKNIEEEKITTLIDTVNWHHNYEVMLWLLKKYGDTYFKNINSDSAQRLIIHILSKDTDKEDDKKILEKVIIKVLLLSHQNPPHDVPGGPITADQLKIFKSSFTNIANLSFNVPIFLGTYEAPLLVSAMQHDPSFANFLSTKFIDKFNLLNSAIQSKEEEFALKTLATIGNLTEKLSFRTKEFQPDKNLFKKACENKLEKVAIEIIKINIQHGTYFKDNVNLEDYIWNAVIDNNLVTLTKFLIAKQIYPRLAFREKVIIEGLAEILECFFEKPNIFGKDYNPKEYLDIHLICPQRLDRKDSNHQKMIELIIQQIINEEGVEAQYRFPVRYRPERNYSLLFVTSYLEYFSSVKLLLSQGAKIDIFTILELIRFQVFAGAEYLLKYSINDFDISSLSVDSKERIAWNELSTATLMQNHLDILNLLIEYFPNLNLKENHVEPRGLLLHAAQIGDLTSLQEISKQTQWQLNWQTPSGITLLMKAAKFAQNNIVDYLLKNSCDIMKDLKLAIEKEHWHYVIGLLKQQQRVDNSYFQTEQGKKYISEIWALALDAAEDGIASNTTVTQICELIETIQQKAESIKIASKSPIDSKAKSEFNSDSDSAAENSSSAGHQSIIFWDFYPKKHKNKATESNENETKELGQTKIKTSKEEIAEDVSSEEIPTTPGPQT